jgi:single-stranded-DNA-specific exonuclease
MALPSQRWLIYPDTPEQSSRLAESFNLHPLLSQVLVNRGILDPKEAEVFLYPEKITLPDPKVDFPDLGSCVNYLDQAIQNHHKIAICGDYDADGMTSTALLLRALTYLGAEVSYEIPSRMTEGYGLNVRMVEDLAAQGIKIILTVDNGISALDPIRRAKELGIIVLVTDHHDIPPEIPPADAILNPKLIAESSPYRGMAGVGVAYLLALTLADHRGSRAELEKPLLELLTLGTIADLAPLQGVNRLWIRKGLQSLTHSSLLGIRALLKVIGLDPEERSEPIRPETIGFGLGPRVNAVGRLAKPDVVIRLLTTEDPTEAQALAQECESLNHQRQHLCQDIEQQILNQMSLNSDLKQDKVLVVLGQDWHHGVIGIVASRLLERYGAPVFIGSQMGEEIRGSARGIPEFNVFEALESCRDLFLKHGGHPAAGGFSLEAKHWPELETRLKAFANQVLTVEHIQPLVQIDTEARLNEMTGDLFDQLQILQPCGLGNREPVFWSRSVSILKQKPLGKDQEHLRFHIQDPSLSSQPISCVWWRKGSLHPLPHCLDVAYTLQAKFWQGEREIQLEIKGVREPSLPFSQDPSSGSRFMIQGSGDPSLPLNQPEADSDLTDELTLIYHPAPPIPHPLEWHEMERLSTQLANTQGTVLLYGYCRPTIEPSSTLTIHTDRPQSGSTYNAIWLWSLPPSITHLAWLLASALPQGFCHQIYVHQRAIPIVSGDTLKRQLRTYLEDHTQIDLLRLSQHWWLAPSTLVAGLRSLGYPCSSFGKTGSTEEELQKLDRWFHSSAATVAHLLAHLQSR